MANNVVIKDVNGKMVGVSGNRLKVDILGQLVPSNYDYISLSYTGDNLTGVVYKTNGSGGTTVATLTLSYTGSVLDSVERS
jgi:hypothetical protein